MHNNVIQGHLPLFVKKPQTGHTFQVLIDNIYSNTNQKNDIIQGSVLNDTLLYLLEISSTTNWLPSGNKISLCLDNCLLYTALNLVHAQCIPIFATTKYLFVHTYQQHSVRHLRCKGPHSAVYTNGFKSSSGVKFAVILSSGKCWFLSPSNASVFIAKLLVM